MMSLRKTSIGNNVYRKIALVTGGNRGIGKQITLTISSVIYITVTTTTQRKHMRKFNFYLNNKGFKNIIILILDLKYKKRIDAFISYIKKKVGVLLIVINNAGTKHDKTVLKLTSCAWYYVMDINLNAIYHIIKSCLPKMIFFNWGRVINISSVVANTGNVGQANYSAAKAGMIGFSKSLAKEVASKGVTVNVISPGFINTTMTRCVKKENINNLIPMERFGKTRDVANMVKMLISNKTSYITGETININGGLYMK